MCKNSSQVWAASIAKLATFIYWIDAVPEDIEKVFKGNNIENFILLAATISLFLEAFPLRSSGSFFTTNNATYITLISSIILSYRNKLTTRGE